MNNGITTPKSVIVTYALVISLLILPVGRSLTPTIFIGIDTSISSMVWYAIFIASPIILIVNAIKTRKTKHLSEWSRIYKRVIFFNLIVFFSNKFSAMSQLGYIHMAPFDILLRLVVYCIFYYWLYDWAKSNYSLEKQSEAIRVVKIIGITQILIFTISVSLNLLALFL